ncbi:uncharacterized protein LOC143033447 [Oratosquilla oratoria]|uniref:uncharacterized protein LOC143033447 n=1 Tax=Oratosquilla oratoria TaxID=337810 RepID=UPI003F75BD18
MKMGCNAELGDGSSVHLLPPILVSHSKLMDEVQNRAYRRSFMVIQAPEAGIVMCRKVNCERRSSEFLRFWHASDERHTFIRISLTRTAVRQVQRRPSLVR